MLEQTPRGTLISLRRPKTSSDTLPPFWTQFTDGKVTITPGYVVDHKTKTGDALAYHTPAGLVDADGKLIEKTIAAGQAVYVKVSVDKTGAIAATSGDAVSVVIASDGQASVHYVPPTGDDEYGAEGSLLYKLAVYRESPEKPQIYLAGSHIQHFHTLQQFRKGGGEHDWFLKYDPDEGKYKTRGITADTPTYSGAEKNIKLTKTDEEIKVKVVGGDLDLVIKKIQESSNGIMDEAYETEATLCWRNGLFVGRYTGTQTTPSAEGTIITQEVSHFVEGFTTDA